MIEDVDREIDPPSYKRRWFKVSLIGLGLCLLGMIVFIAVRTSFWNRMDIEPIHSGSAPSTDPSTPLTYHEPSKLESISKDSWDKLYSFKDTIPKVSFLSMRHRKHLRTTEFERDVFELTSKRNLLNNPSRLRQLSKKVKRVINGVESIEEQNYQFIVKIKDGFSGNSNLKSFIRENNVLTSNIFSIVTTASHVTNIVKSNAVEWVGEYESGFKSTLDFQKLQTKAIELQRNPNRRFRNNFRNRFNSTTVSQKIDQSTMIRVVVSVIPSLQSISTGTQKKETENLAKDINTILSRKYVRDIDFLPMTVSTESICEIAFSPRIATYVGYVLTSHPNVHYIHRKLTLSISNKQGRQILQSVHPSRPQETPFYNMGIYGDGQVVAVADTGLDWDHCFFFDSIRTSSPTSYNLNRRKVVRILNLYSGDSTDIVNGHGTHVVGSVVGSMENTPSGSGVNSFHGVAPSAKVFFTDLAPEDGSALYLPEDITDLFTTPYVTTASPKIFSNSWGCSVESFVDCLYDCSECFLVEDIAPYQKGQEVTNQDCHDLFGVDKCCEICNVYDAYSQGFDAFIWSKQDVAIFIAQGNDGQTSRFGNIGSPANCKNAISVGAHHTSNEGFVESANYESTGDIVSITNSYLQHTNIYNEHNLAAFSSRGPAAGGRIKPDIVAAGFTIVSARSDGSVNTRQCGTGFPSQSNNAALLTKSGTSMATPIAAGGALLLREYFIKRLNIAAPSGHLIKAAMVHSSIPLDGSVAYLRNELERFNIAEAFGSPNYYDGFGKAQLGSLLNDERGRNLSLSISQQSFTNSNQALKLCFRLKKNISDDSSFRATLAWYDPPSSVAVSPDLINNLDLIVNTYIWNNVTSTHSPVKVFYGNGGTYIDTKNNIEKVTIASIQNVEDPERQVMVSVQVLNSGITGTNQPFTLLSSVVNGYWDTLSTEQCIYQLIPEIEQSFSNSSTPDNSTLTNSTVNHDNCSCTNETYDSTDNRNDTTVLNGSSTDDTDFTNSTNGFNETTTDPIDTPDVTFGFNETDTNTTDSMNNTDITNSTNGFDETNTNNNITDPIDTPDAKNSTFGFNETDTNTTDTMNNTEITNSTNGFNETNTDPIDTPDINNTTSGFNGTENNTTMNISDNTNSTNGFNGTETDNINATHCFGYAETSYHVCSTNGLCVGENNCSCFEGYYGENCELPVCFGIFSYNESCSGHGYCIKVNTCSCDSGFTGDNCSVITCNSKSEAEGGCSHHGSCIENICVCNGNFEGDSCSRCKKGYGGENCDILVCNGLLATSGTVCSGRGFCHFQNSSVPECLCKDGYSGLSCEFVSCNGINSSSDNDVCSGRGNCVDIDTCICNGNYDPQEFCKNCLPDFAGTSCNRSVCFDNITCNSHGACNVEGECECFGNWTGPFCNLCKEGFVGIECKTECLASTSCNNRGTCNDNGTCSCFPNTVGLRCNECENGWFGNDCSFGIYSSSFGFDYTGNLIYGTIYSTYSQQITCTRLITDITVLGTNPVCNLDGKTSNFNITLGSSATIIIGDSISLRTYPDSPSSVRINITKKDFLIRPPIASLVSDRSSIGIGCGKMVLDASASTSTDNRQLYYSWSTISAPNEISFLLLSNLLNNITAPIVSFSPDNLTPGSYKIQVKVISSFSGNYSTASFSLMISEKALPQITIREGSESSFMIGSTAVISPLITLPTCFDTSQNITYIYTLDTTRSADSITIKQDHQNLVFSDSFTRIVKEGDYYFTLSAAGVSISFKVTARSRPLQVRFNIGDMSQSFEDFVNFIVHLHDPSDPTGNTGSLTITCIEEKTSGTCDGFSSSTHNFSPSITFNRSMRPGSYLFNAAFTKGPRKTAASLKITVLDVSKSTILRVVIVPPGNVPTSVLDPSSDLILEATTKETLSSASIYQWSSPNLVLSSTSNRYLVISKSLLSPGTTYTVNLRIEDGSKSGSTSLTFTTNSPPTAGIFTVLPSQGITLQDLFEINCGIGWMDTHLPLSYMFVYKLKGSSDEWKVLSPSSEKNSISLYLPLGNWEIKAIVSDYYGASTESVSEVNVSIPQNIAATVEFLRSIEKEVPSVSIVSSVLSLIRSVSAQSNAQNTELVQSGTTFIQQFFRKVEEPQTSLTTASVSSITSVMTSISQALDYLDETAVSFSINRFMDSMTKVNKDSVIMKSSDIDASIKSTDTFKEFIYSRFSKRSPTSFTSSDLNNIETIYDNLVNLKLRTLVADMSAIRVAGVNSHRYGRVVRALTLNGLSENIAQGISQPFTLSSTFSSIAELNGVERVTLSLKSSKVTNSSASLATKALEFNLFVSNSPITISSTSTIAQLSLERVASTRTATGLDCRIETSTGVFSKTPNCTIVTSTSNLVTVSVKSTGIYVVINSQELTTPVTSNLDTAPDIDYGITYIIIAGSIVVAVILGSIISICILFCVLSRLLKGKRKKRKKDAKKHLELQSVEVSKFQNILRPPSSYYSSSNSSNSPRPNNFGSPRYY